MWTSFGAFLMAIIVPLVKKAVVALGFGFVVYQGFDALLGWLISWIQGEFGALPTALAHMAGRLGIDKAASIIVSAGIVKLTLRAMFGPKISHPVWRAPGDGWAA